MKEGPVFEQKTSQKAEELKEFEGLKTTAQIIGGDFGMKVEIGKSGEGSKYSPIETRIILDPAEIKESPDHAEYTVGHEGSHRAITLGPNELGLKEEKILDLYNKLGFSSLINTLEDTAVDSWAMKKFEGLRQAYNKVWDEDLKIGAIPGAPEAMGAMQMLGRIPKFLAFLQEIYKFWHQGEFSENLDPEVKGALEKTEKSWQQVYNEIPGPYRDKKEILERGRERLKITLNKIWPEFQKLVEKDFNQEKINQMLQDMAERSEKAVEELIKNLSQKEGEELKEKLEKGQGKEDKQEGENGEKEGPKEMKSKESKEGEGESKGKEGGQESSKLKIPIGAFSPELMDALQKIFNQLPKETQEKLREGARKSLEKLEDALNEKMRGKLNLDNPPTHEELKEGFKDEKEEEERLEKMREQMDKFIENQFSVYDQHYKEVASLINELYNKLEKVFLPTKYPRWKKGYPAGGKVSLEKAMEFERDPSKYTELFERKTLPEKKDYRISLLIDLSGSMAGKKIEETFKGMVVLAEVLDKLEIQFEVIGFQDTIIPYKSFQEKLDNELRGKMGVALGEPTNHGAHNQADHNSDGYCLEQVYQRLIQNKGKDNFLIVLSDGLPAPDPRHAGEKWKLEKIISHIKEGDLVELIGIGLGPETEHVKDFYPKSVVLNEVEKLPENLSKLLEDIILKRI